MVLSIEYLKDALVGLACQTGLAVDRLMLMVVGSERRSKSGERAAGCWSRGRTGSVRAFAPPDRNVRPFGACSWQGQG